jgi:hypothetical protein
MEELKRADFSIGGLLNDLEAIEAAATGRLSQLEVDEALREAGALENLPLLCEKGDLGEESAGASFVAAAVSPALEGVDLATIFSTDIVTDTCARRPGYQADERRSGDRKARIVDYAVYNSAVLWPATVASGRPVDLYYKIVFADEMTRPLIGLTIRTLAGQSVFASNNLWMERRLSPVRSGDVKVYRLATRLVLPVGRYSLEFAVASSVEAIADRREGISLLEIVDDQPRTMSGFVDFEQVS